MRSVYHGMSDVGQVASEAVGWAGRPAPPSLVLLWLPRCSCGYWRKNNGLRLGQRPGGRRYCWPLSWAFGAGVLPPGAARGKGPRRIRVAAGQTLGTQSAQDCQSVRIYAYDQCPRQDSNLRSRLRRGLLCTTLTSGNDFPHTMIGGVSGATAWSRLPGRNGMSSNWMRRLHSKTHPLVAGMRYVGTPSSGHWRFGHHERVQCSAQKLTTQRGQPEGCSSACNRRSVSSWVMVD
jgi:hypothetical protein